jgi:hypothetical protein
MTSPNPASGRVSPRPPEVSALFALASQDRDAMTVLGALQALVDRRAARWSVDADGAVHLILAHGTAFAVDPAHLTRIC